MQGYDSQTQPREFYEDARDYLPNAKDAAVRFLPEGHFYILEFPDDVTQAIRHLLEM
jgi:pimeloyl-ACP methyl ester carboxylesterase